MIKYKLNLKFKENGKSLNEIISNALKIELEKCAHITCNKSKIDESSNNNSQNERSMN